jgi:hypothetical protein
VTTSVSSLIERYVAFSLSLLVLLSLSFAAFAQTTISTGSIQGTITDPSGAVVSGAKVSIRNKASLTGLTGSGTVWSFGLEFRSSTCSIWLTSTAPLLPLAPSWMERQVRRMEH